jgi:hypothetical protein
MSVAQENLSGIIPHLPGRVVGCGKLTLKVDSNIVLGLDLEW